MSLNKILTDKQQEFILKLSTQMKTQDNLATAAPYLYLLTQKREEVRPDTHSDDYVLYLDFESIIYNNDELIEYVKDEYPALTEWLEDNLTEPKEFLQLDIDDGLKRVQDEYEDFCRHYDEMNVVYYEEVQEASKNNLNVFFTKEAYDKHVSANMHHYNNPKSYLKHMFRNPELEGILDVIGTLAQALEIKNEKVCLWSKTNDSSFIGCNHQSLHATQITQFSNCPFCGGKIEVV